MRKISHIFESQKQRGQSAYGRRSRGVFSARLPFVHTRGGASRRPRPTGVTAQRRAATWGNTKACPVNAVGAGHWPARRGASAIPEPPSSASLRSAPSPWKGEGLRAGHGPAPTAETRPGALVRQSQAQKLNHSSGNFPHIQGPVARQEFRPVTQILRAGNSAQPYWYASPVTGSGERRL